MSGDLATLRPVEAHWPRDRYYNIWAEANEAYRAAERARLRQRPWRYAIFNNQFPIPKVLRETGRELLRTDWLIVFENPALDGDTTSR